MQSRQIMGELRIRIGGLLAPALQGLGLLSNLSLQRLEVGGLHLVLAGAVDLPDQKGEREHDSDISSERDVGAGRHSWLLLNQPRQKVSTAELAR